MVVCGVVIVVYCVCDMFLFLHTRGVALETVNTAGEVFLGRGLGHSHVAHVRPLQSGTFDLGKEETKPLDTGGGRVFSLNASFSRMATRWRLWRQCDSSALRSAFVV